MKLIVVLFLFLTINVSSQNLKDLLKEGENILTKKVDSSSAKKSSSNNLSNTDISSGLKEALQKGAEQSIDKLSTTDGFFKDAVVKILMPPEAQKVETTLRKIGFNKEVDDAILSMNRAAENASKNAAPIFVKAIKEINFIDAMNILKGGDSAATKYLREKTSTQLSTAFKPVIQESLQKTNATKYWETLTTAYDKIPFVKKINTDLTEYVTTKALTGIFYQMALEEQKIRTNPLAQTTDLLRKVFGK